MSNHKAYLVHFLMLILSLSFFMGPSLAAPALNGSLSDASTTLVDAADSLQQAVDDATSTIMPTITPTPVQNSPDDGTTITTTTPLALTSMPSAFSSGVTPSPTVELVPPVTVLKQLGTTAIVEAAQGKTRTIRIPNSDARSAATATGSSVLVTSDSVALTISSSMIAAGLAVGAWIVF